MAELLVEYTVPIEHSSGLFWPRALTRVADDGLWEGWLEFARDGTDEVVSTARETEQPTRDMVLYWATGLSATYLEGALERALRPAPALVQRDRRVVVDASPRPTPRGGVQAQTRAILDPFQAYGEGEQLLRKQLRALSHDHLQNIIEHYRLHGDHDADWVRRAPEEQLVDRIVEGVRERLRSTSG